MAVRKKTEKKPIENWEREALEKIALSALDEQRIARRWSIFLNRLHFFISLCFYFWHLVRCTQKAAQAIIPR